jgi:hypothetical protein
MAIVESYNWGVTPILAMVKGERMRSSKLGSATGFFYCHEGKLYLITNRHVAVEEDEGYFPNTFKIKIHDSNTIQRSIREIELPLYDENMNPVWHEYMHDREVDIIALSVDEYLNERDVIWRWSKDDFPSPSEVLVKSSEISIIGYPLEFYDDVHNFPITRSASIASPYGVAFKNKKYFLIDANLHKGISGSPVIIPRSRVRKGKPIHALLGILSARERAELGVVWYPQLIEEIVVEENRARLSG